jgi:hypothetical protein
MTKHKVLVLSFLDFTYISIVCVQNSFVFGVYVFEQSKNYNSTFWEILMLISLKAIIIQNINKNY